MRVRRSRISSQWFLAEGATPPFFHLFILIANPNELDAQDRPAPTRAADTAACTLGGRFSRRGTEALGSPIWRATNCGNCGVVGMCKRVGDSDAAPGESFLKIL
jgi:hypothetical protein